MGTARVGHFAEPGFLVLVALLGGPAHGYAIGTEIEGLSGNAPGPGTLYGAIGRLERAGLIAAQPGDGRRRPYALTAAGETEARARIDELGGLAREAERRLRRARAVAQ